MLGLGYPFQSGGESSVGDPVVEYLSAVVDHRVTPFRFVLVGGDLAGDVGDHRTVSEDFSWVFVGPGKRGQVDMNIDYSPIRPSGRVATGEKVDEDVGAELVHRETVEFSADRDGTVGGKTVGVEVGGPVGGRFDNDPTF
jgi:hypothetical protein